MPGGAPGAAQNNFSAENRILQWVQNACQWTKKAPVWALRGTLSGVAKPGVSGWSPVARLRPVKGLFVGLTLE